MSAVEGFACGLKKGYPVTKIDEKKTRANRHKGTISKKTKVVREIVREISGFSPYERRVMELLRISKDKKALKFLKKRLGSHKAAKAKREDMQDVLTHMRKQHK